jgi:hypothetical protein
MRHAQLIEDNTRAELNSLADKLNELSARFEHHHIPTDILTEPLDTLEKWRAEAYQTVDRIVQNKRQELNVELEKYRTVSLTRHEQELTKVNSSKKLLAELIQEGDTSTHQMATLRTSINDAEKYFNTPKVPAINVTTHVPNWSVTISTNFCDKEVKPNDQIREFSITYIRLNGLIRKYYVKTKKDGTMNHLLRSFVRQYTAVEQSAQIEMGPLYIVDHLSKPDFILPVAVCDRRVRLHFSSASPLSQMSERDVIVFYETPYSLNEENNPCILMPCVFQRLPLRESFAWPIYLSVPRHGCKGRDIQDTLCDALGKFFSFDPHTQQTLYDAYLETTPKDMQKETKLQDALNDEMDFSKTNVTLLVHIDGTVAVKYK